MTRRWGAALLALACLLPQAALALHHHEHEEAHADCACGPREAFECSDADCGSKEHHHHERAHDPASCRACSAADVAPLLHTADIDLVAVAADFEAPERAVPTARPLDLWRSGRGPPA